MVRVRLVSERGNEKENSHTAMAHFDPFYLNSGGKHNLKVTTLIVNVVACEGNGQHSAGIAIVMHQSTGTIRKQIGNRRLHHYCHLTVVRQDRRTIWASVCMTSNTRNFGRTSCSSGSSDKFPQMMSECVVNSDQVCGTEEQQLLIQLLRIWCSDEAGDVNINERGHQVLTVEAVHNAPVTPESRRQSL